MLINRLNIYQIGTIRPIRVDHTNCLQVTIKTHSFIHSFLKWDTGLQNRYGPVRPHQPPKKTRSGVVSFVGPPKNPGVVSFVVTTRSTQADLRFSVYPDLRPYLSIFIFVVYYKSQYKMRFQSTCFAISDI
jgi:hypothetical protein